MPFFLFGVDPIAQPNVWVRPLPVPAQQLPQKPQPPPSAQFFMGN